MFEWIGDQIGKIIWNNLLMWLYETIYQAAADFFAMMGNMGAEIFDLSWVAAVVQLFSLFGWALFGIGMVTAVFDAAIEYQNGRGNLNMTALNVLKGFFAASLIGILPIELYRFSISLQNTLSGELLGIFTADGSGGFSGKVVQTLSGNFLIEDLTEVTLLAVLILIAFAYAITKVFFQNIKHPACADCGRLDVSIQCAARVYRWLYSVDQAGDRAVSDGVSSDHAFDAGADDLSWE